VEEFAACWEELDDPRTGNAALHDFIELLVIALCSVLSGGQGAVDMGLYARAKEPFLRGFLKLTNGLGLSRKRVDKWIRLPALPERNAMTPTPCTPAFFHEHLSHRWASGCTDGRKLFGEITELGYKGCYSYLARHLSKWRHRRDLCPVSCGTCRSTQ
jgi:hypothetical protein